MPDSYRSLRPWYWDALVSLAFFGQAIFLGRAFRGWAFVGLFVFLVNAALGWFFARAAWRALTTGRGKAR